MNTLQRVGLQIGKNRASFTHKDLYKGFRECKGGAK